MTLLALLPTEPQAPLLAAVLAWRGCTYAVPALLGAALAIKGPGPVAATPRPGPNQLDSGQPRRNQPLAPGGSMT